MLSGILFVWLENGLVFSSEFEQNSIKNNSIKKAPCPPPPPPHTHTHVHTHARIYFKTQHAKGSINGSQEKGTHIFYKTIQIV